MDEVTKTFVFYLTIFLIVIKFVLCLFLGKKVVDKKRNQIEAGVKFLSATTVMMAGMFIARILFTIFDFHYTHFDRNTYILPEPLFLWKLSFGMLTVTLFYMIWVLDKVIVQNKFKGIPAIILIIVGFIVIIYPVETVEDFELMSLISLVVNMMALLVPAVFSYVGKHSSGDIRKSAYFIAFGLMLYIISTILVNEGIILPTSALLGFDTGILLWILSISGKCIGLVIFSQFAAKFVSD